MLQLFSPGTLYQSQNALLLQRINEYCAYTDLHITYCIVIFKGITIFSHVECSQQRKQTWIVVFCKTLGYMALSSTHYLKVKQKTSQVTSDYKDILKKKSVTIVTISSLFHSWHSTLQRHPSTLSYTCYIWATSQHDSFHARYYIRTWSWCCHTKHRHCFWRSDYFSPRSRDNDRKDLGGKLLCDNLIGHHKDMQEERSLNFSHVQQYSLFYVQISITQFFLWKY